MSSERWTAETKMLVRRHIASACAAIATAPGTASPYDISIERAERLLGALADVGLLIQPGGETREEWGYRWPDGEVVPVENAVNVQQATKVSRTVHAGPWRQASGSDENGAEGATGGQQ